MHRSRSSQSQSAMKLLFKQIKFNSTLPPLKSKAIITYTTYSIPWTKINSRRRVHVLPSLSSVQGTPRVRFQQSFLFAKGSPPSSSSQSNRRPQLELCIPPPKKNACAQRPIPSVSRPKSNFHKYKYKISLKIPSITYISIIRTFFLIS